MNDPNLCPIHKIPFKETPYGTKCTKFVGKDSTGKSLFCGLKPQIVTQHQPIVAVESFAGQTPASVMGGELYVGAAQSPQQPRQGQTVLPTDCSSTSSLRDQAGGATGTNWAAKDRLICAQTAVKAACIFYQQSGATPESVFALAQDFHEAFLRVQNGLPLTFPPADKDISF